MEVREEMPSMTEWEVWVKAEAKTWLNAHPYPVMPVIITPETEKCFIEMRTEHQRLWADYIKEEGTRWWKDKGFLVIWPEEANKPLNFIRLPKTDSELPKKEDNNEN